MQRGLLLRLWVFLLTACAGFANSLGSVSYFLRPAHHTGNIFLIAESLLPGNTAHAFLILFLVACFYGGSFIGGYVFSTDTRKNKKYYWIFPACFGVCFFFLQLFERTIFPIFAIALILGAQNSIPVFVSGIRVRTTHITGNLTDSAFYLGTAVHKKSKPIGSITLLLTILSFLIGSMLGIAIPNRVAYTVLGFVYLFAALWYLVLLKKE